MSIAPEQALLHAELRAELLAEPEQNAMGRRCVQLELHAALARKDMRTVRECLTDPTLSGPLLCCDIDLRVLADAVAVAAEEARRLGESLDAAAATSDPADFWVARRDPARAEIINAMFDCAAVMEAAMVLLARKTSAAGSIAEVRENLLVAESCIALTEGTPGAMVLALDECCRCHNVALARRLLAAIPRDALLPACHTVAVAANAEDLEMVDLLLAHGAQVNRQEDYRGMSVAGFSRLYARAPGNYWYPPMAGSLSSRLAVPLPPPPRARGAARLGRCD